jgi:hypothetical protein
MIHLFFHDEIKASSIQYVDIDLWLLIQLSLKTFLHSFCFVLLGGSTDRDQSMREDSRTKGQVEDNIDSDTFNTDFAKAMIALSQIDVLRKFQGVPLPMWSELKRTVELRMQT